MAKAEEIKSRAIRLMAEKGYGAVSLRQLADAAGLQPGSFYAHYRSKAQLLRKISLRPGRSASCVGRVRGSNS